MTKNKSPKKSTVDEAVDLYYQQRFLRILLLILVGIIALQALVSVFLDSLYVAGFSVMVLAALWVSVFVLHKGYYQLASSLTILILLSLLVFSVLIDGLSNATTFWFFVFPVVATFLRGKDGGTIWLLTVVLVILAIYVATQMGYIAVDVISYDADTFMQLILAVFLVAIFVYFYQDNLDKKTESVSQREGKLSQIYTQLQDEIKHREAVTASLDENLKIMSRQSAQNQALLESIGEGVIALDQDGKVIMANHVTMELFNFYKRDIINKKYVDVFKLYEDSGEEIDSSKHPIMATLKSQSGQHTSEYYCRNYNQELLPVSITTSPVQGDDGEIIGAIQVFRDISEERAVARAKDEFLSLASHQLRTPLGAIRWYAERLLKTADLADKDRKYLNTIYEDSARMSGLLSDYLDASRLQLRVNALKPKQQDVSEVVDKIIGDLKPIIKDKKLKIAKNMKEGATISTDSQLLEMIVQNLVSNAVKYTPAEGKVTVSVSSYRGNDKRLKGGLVLNVEDTGMGIPEDEQHNVFTKLFRAENAVTSDIEGTGLGLYSVKEAVSRLGGDIWFESKPGKGTHFAVTLPNIEPDTIEQKEDEDD